MLKPKTYWSWWNKYTYTSTPWLKSKSSVFKLWDDGDLVGRETLYPCHEALN